MAKSKKENIEITQEQHEVQSERVGDIYNIEPIAESIEKMQDNSVAEQPKGQTETEFLKRILHIQHTGGFGRHLDDIINERIKELNAI